MEVFVFFFQAEDGIRDISVWLEFRRVLFRSGLGTITWYSDGTGNTVIGTGSPLTLTNPGVGSYTYYVNEAGACPSSMDSVIVIVGGVTAVINATPETGVIPLNVSFDGTNSIGAIIGYQWDFEGDGVIDDTQSSTNSIYSTIGDYNVMLIVTDGICSDTAYVIIDAFGESAILIPNVFTPNGDGINDIFSVDGINLESVEGEIFNRWRSEEHTSELQSHWYISYAVFCLKKKKKKNKKYYN